MPGRWILPLLGLLMLMPSAGWAQAGDSTECGLQGQQMSQIDDGAGGLINIMHSPFTVTCDDGVELRADSGQVNRTTGEVHLVGNVYFNDSVQTLTADEATYSRDTDRLFAQGNVDLVNRAEGTSLTGPELEYFRANEEREEALVFATQRPTLIMEPRDSAGNPRGSEPLTLVGDRVNIVGNDDLTSAGNVVITQEDLTATAEEAHYDSTNETLELRQNALIIREGSSISGEVVQARLVEGSLQHVQSRTDARLEGEDLTVAAPDIQIFFDRDTLQQVVARVPAELAGERSRAASRTFRTEADSIDARFVAGALDVVYAIGAARGETIDTLQAGAGSLEMVTTPESPDVPGDSIGPVPGVADASAVSPEVPSPSAPVEPQSDGEQGAGRQDADAEVAPDAPPSAETIAAVTASDWIRGDTIIALFAGADSVSESTSEELPPPPAAGEPDPPELPEVDCTSEPCPEPQAPEERETPQLRKLIARLEAQSFYRLASEDPARPECRNLSFLVGSEIELDVADGELEVANVRGLEQGLYLEASGCASAPPAAAPLDEGGLPDGDESPDPGPATPTLDTAMARSWE